MSLFVVMKTKLNRCLKIMDIRLALALGTPITVPELTLTINQPKLKEIALMGENDFFMASQFICIKKESITQDKTVLQQLNNFQVFMEIIKQSNQKERKQAINILLSLIFPDKRAILTPSSIILRGDDSEAQENTIIDKENFELLQSYLSKIFCVHSMQGDNVVYNPGNARAKRIMDKIMEGRKKVAAIKAQENKESIIGRYVSILAIGSGFSLAELGELTLYQFFDLVERFSLQLNWDIDFKIRLAGGKPKKEADSWLKPLHEDRKK